MGGYKDIDTIHNDKSWFLYELLCLKSNFDIKNQLLNKIKQIITPIAIILKQQTNVLKS